MLPSDDFENLFEWSRTVLERVGCRMGIDSIIILLPGSKIGQLVASGTELNSVNLSLGDLYLKPEGSVIITCLLHELQIVLMDLENSRP